MTKRSKPEPAPRPRRYTDEEKANALAIYRTEGPREAARRLNIPHRTISRWAADRGVSTDVTAKTARATAAAKARAARKRAELREMLLDEAIRSLKLANRPHIELKVVSDGRDEGSHVEKVTIPLPSPSGRQAYVTSAAILLDKYRLEVGEATERREVDVHDARERLAGRLAELAERRGAGKPARGSQRRRG